MIYLICFFLSVSATYFAQKKLEQKEKSKGILFSIIAIIIPAALAGFRDPTIGFDVKIYVDRYFRMAQVSNNLEQYFYTYDNEFLYGVLNYGVSRLFSDVHWLYFFASLIPTTFIYLGLVSYRDKVPLWLGMLVYLLLFYNLTLNLVRQSIALGIVFFATRYIQERKLLNYALLIFLAGQFHNTAYFGFSLYFIYLLVTGEHRLLIKIAVIAGMLLFLAEFINIIGLLIGMGLIPAKFEVYLAESATGFSLHVFSPDTFFRLFFIIVFAGLYPYLVSYSKMNSYFFVLLLCDFILLQVGNLAWQFSSRISYYFGYMQLCTLPQIGLAFSRNYRWLVQGLLIAALLTYWYINYVYLGYHETWPYSSSLLGI